MGEKLFNKRHTLLISIKADSSTASLSEIQTDGVELVEACGGCHFPSFRGVMAALKWANQ